MADFIGSPTKIHVSDYAKTPDCQVAEVKSLMYVKIWIFTGIF